MSIFSYAQFLNSSLSLVLFCFLTTRLCPLCGMEENLISIALCVLNMWRIDNKADSDSDVEWQGTVIRLSLRLCYYRLVACDVML